MAVSVVQSGSALTAKSDLSTAARPAGDRGREAQAEQFQGVLAVMQFVQGLQSSGSAGSSALQEDALFEDPGAGSGTAGEEAAEADAVEVVDRRDGGRPSNVTRQGEPVRQPAPADGAGKEPPPIGNRAGAMVTEGRSEPTGEAISPPPGGAGGDASSDTAVRATGHARPAAAGLAAPPIAPNAAAVQLRELTGAGARGVESPARQVAQILGAGRGGDSSGSTAPSAAPASRQSGEASPRTPSAGRDPQSEKSASPGRSEAESGEVESAARTPFERLIRSARTQIGPRVSNARLVLDPPELGRLDVQVRLEAGRLSIGVKAETREARDLLMLRGDELKSALEQHGLRVERFDVILDSDGAISSFADRGYSSGRERPEAREANRESAARRGVAGTGVTGEVGNAANDAMTEVDSSRRLDIRI